MLLATAAPALAKGPRRRIDLRLVLPETATESLTRAPRRPEALDYVTRVSEKVFSGAASHVTALGSLTFDRVDVMATGLLGGVWNF